MESSFDLMSPALIRQGSSVGSFVVLPPGCSEKFADPASLTHGAELKDLSELNRGDGILLSSHQSERASDVSFDALSPAPVKRSLVLRSSAF